MASVFPRVVLPRVDAELADPRDDMEGPAKRTRAHVVRTDVAGRRFLTRRRVAHGRSDDHDVAAHLRRTGPAVGRGVVAAEAQGYAAALADVRIRLAGFGIQGRERAAP